MTEKIYNKLVRDRIPQIIEADGSTPHVEVLDNERYIEELKNKFVEEATEVRSATTKEEIIEELADMSELAIALREAYDVDAGTVEAKRIEKELSRGGFKEGLFLKSVDEVENKGA